MWRVDDSGRVYAHTPIHGLRMWPIEKFDGHCELVYKSRLSWKCVVHPIKTEMETCPSFSEGNVETLRQGIPYSEKTVTQFAKYFQKGTPWQILCRK